MNHPNEIAAAVEQERAEILGTLEKILTSEEEQEIGGEEWSLFALGLVRATNEIERRGPSRDYRSLCQEIVAAYKEYVDLLNREINSLIGIASTHGYRSQLVEAGKAGRAKIDALLQEFEEMKR